MANQQPASNIAAFFASLWGRILAVLTAIALLLGITAEGFSVYRSWQDSQIAANNILKSKAEQCSARIKAIIDGVPVDQVARATEIVQRDCDPTYAERMERAAYRAYLDLRVKNINAMTAADAKRNYAESLLYAEKLVSVAEEEQRRNPADRNRSDIMMSLRDVSERALLTGDFKKALASADRALDLFPGNMPAQFQRALALIFSGQADEGKAFLLSENGTYDHMTAEAFARIRAVGLSHPAMAEIEDGFRRMGRNIAPPRRPAFTLDGNF